MLSCYQEMEDLLNNAHTISDIIDIIQKHSSILYCQYLQHVAEHFKLAAVIEKIEEHHKYINEFCQHKLANHTYLKPFLTTNLTTTITFKLTWNPNDKTLYDIQSLLRRTFKKYSDRAHIVVVRGDWRINMYNLVLVLSINFWTINIYRHWLIMLQWVKRHTVVCLNLSIYHYNDGLFCNYLN